MTIDTTNYPDDFAELMRECDREITALMNRLESGEISVNEWEDEMKRVQARYAQAAKLLGNGKSELSDIDKSATRSWLNEQYKYLGGFANVISSAGGEYSHGWLPRAEMYGTATSIEYWEGVTEGLPLPAQPAQGTQCLSNCRCSWRIEWIDKENGDADCYWEFGDADHCQTCETRHEMWYPIRIRGGDLGEPLPREPKPPAQPAPAKLSPHRDVFKDPERAVSQEPGAADGLQYVKQVTGSKAESLRKYTNFHSDAVNSDLRAGRTLESMTTGRQQMVKDIDNLFAKAPASTTDYTVVRGGYIPPKLKKGSQFSDNAYVSTSSSAEVARHFVGLNSKDGIYVIRVPKGSKTLPIGDASGHSLEQEILLNRGSRFTVDRITRTFVGVQGAGGSFVTVIYATLIP